MAMSNNIEFLSEILETQMKFIRKEENVLHTRIFNENGEFIKKIKGDREFDFFNSLAIELKSGKSFGTIYLDDINKEDKEKNVYCTLKAISKLENFMVLKDSHYESIVESLDLEVKNNEKKMIKEGFMFK